jgi:hypothetical protein
MISGSSGYHAIVFKRDKLEAKGSSAYLAGSGKFSVDILSVSLKGWHNSTNLHA